jgi:hypothetical protein
MLDAFLKFAGPLQALLGAGGAFAPGLAGALGTGTGGNLVNLLSGLAASYLGFKGSPEAQQNGAKYIGAANMLVGLLAAAGVNQIAGIPLSQGNVAMAVNLAVGLWGLAAGFMANKQRRIA